MTTTVNKYQIYCQTEALWVTTWNTTPPTVCPNNPGHTVTLSSVSIVDSLSSSDITFKDSPVFDAFGRLRISENRNLLNFKQLYSNMTFSRMDSQTTGSATITYNSNSVNTTLTCTTNATDRAIFQLKEYLCYQAGTSSVIVIAANINSQKTNVQQLIGYFDADNGLYFEMNGASGINIGYRSKASGSVVSTLVPRASWNGDRLDGTGPSQYTIDFATSQLWYIDFQWQGTGRVRWGVYNNGRPIVCHSENFNNLSTVPYTAMPNLPPRIEIANTGTSASSTSVHLTCIASYIETTTDPTGVHFSIFSTTGNAVSTTVLTPVLSIRLKTTFQGKPNRMKIDLRDFQVIAAGTSVHAYSLVRNAVLATPSWVSTNTDSGIEWDHASTTMTGGNRMMSGVFSDKHTVTNTNSTFLDFNNSSLALNIDGTVSDIYTIAAIRTNGNVNNIYSSISWSEIY